MTAVDRMKDRATVSDHWSSDWRWVASVNLAGVDSLDIVFNTIRFFAKLADSTNALMLDDYMSGRRVGLFTRDR